MVEAETAMRFVEVGGDAERGDGLGNTVLPVPEPDRIDMGVADEVNIFLRLGYPLRLRLEFFLTAALVVNAEATNIARGGCCEWG